MCKNKKLPMIPFSELKGKEFFIPYQQRGYKWTSTNVCELLNDLKEFINNPDSQKRVYCLQPLAVVSLGLNEYSVLDGQQRLTTLFLLYIYLYGEAPYTFKYERDQSDGKISRFEYLSNIAKRTSDEATQNIDFYYIYNAYHQIEEVFNHWGEDLTSLQNNTHIDKEIENLKKSFRTLLDANANEKSIQVIWYQVEENKQYETFRNLNSGKIHLTNTELIKALLLNRVSGLPTNERLEAAATFELIEREMQNDHFWYMFNGNELRSGQTRMDFLFNLVSGCKQADYDLDSRWSFRNYFSDIEKGSLSVKWKLVRQTFLILKDMYDNIYSYHYIGFLTYCNPKTALGNTRNLLSDYQGSTHSKFIEKLKGNIKKILIKHHKSVKDYSYDQSKKHDLRLLFVMHNVETILQKYELLHENKQLFLQKEFEQFPFELLHKQNWDIEHIASNTDADFKNPTDRKNWLESIKKDLDDKFPTDDVVTKFEEVYHRTKKKEDFDKLYHAIMRRCDDMIEDSIKDNAPDGKNKMQIGNITLLDSHTNRSYHNALFPRKRKYIIVADGLCDKFEESENGIMKLYIPPCTRQVFTKAYTKNGNLSLNTWTQTDADAYVKDMEQKLEFYFGKPQKS